MKTEFFTSVGLLIIRVVLGLIMCIAHGWQKLTGFGEMADKFFDPLGMGSQLSLIAAIGAEFGCSILLILGLATRVAAIPLAFTMAIAAFVVHSDDPWQEKELAIAYLTVFSSLVFTGAGKFSLDALIFKSKKDKAKTDETK